MKTPNKGDYPPKPIPAAKAYKARLIWWIDLGTQKKEFKGKPKEIAEVFIGFELIGTKAKFHPDKPEQPFMVSNTYTVSLNEKSNLRKLLKSWKGEDFTDQELELASKDSAWLANKFLGKPGLLTVEHNKSGDKTYANIGSLIRVPEEMGKTPQPENKLILFDIEGQDRGGIFLTLPEFLQKKIELSPEWSRNPFKETPIAPAEEIGADEF